MRHCWEGLLRAKVSTGEVALDAYDTWNTKAESSHSFCSIVNTLSQWEATTRSSLIPGFTLRSAQKLWLCHATKPFSSLIAKSNQACKYYWLKDSSMPNTLPEALEANKELHLTLHLPSSMVFIIGQERKVFRPGYVARGVLVSFFIFLILTWRYVYCS